MKQILQKIHQRTSHLEYFVLICLAVAFFVAVTMKATGIKLTMNMQPEGMRCIGYSYYLHYEKGTPGVGDIAVVSLAMLPERLGKTIKSRNFFVDEPVVAKYLAATAGDTVKHDPETGLWVNGKLVTGALDPEFYEKAVVEFNGIEGVWEKTLKHGEILLYGISPYSLDGRILGPISDEYIRGKAWPII